MRNDHQRIVFLDYWQGHYSRFRHPNPLPDEFRQHFPKPERPSGKANWFEDFVRELTMYFVGRDEELSAIDKFVAQSPKKVLVVIGVPGIGKSALLAKWADEHQAVRHFLREGDVATYEPVHVFKNLAIQLSEKYGVTWQEPDRPEPPAYRSAFDQTLQEASEKGQIILVIDGLDEGVRAQTRGKPMEYVQTIVDWLPEPNFLPDGVRMILSTRPELLEHRSFVAKYGEDKAEHLQLGRMTDSDVRALLYQVKSKDEVLENQDYVKAIVERSEGNPLYLRMLLEDIAEGRIAFGDINQLPKGVIAYFERILDFIESEGRTREMPDIEVILQAKQETLERLVQDGILTQEQAEAHLERERTALEWHTGVRSIELLALFCLAKEPISLDFAADVLRAEKEEVHRAFEVIRTVLIDDRGGKFTIFHSAFRDYFLNLGEYTKDRLHRHKDTIDKVQNHLLAYCSRWQEHKSDYALRHYAEHLHETPDKLPELFERARDEEFAKTQQQILPHEPNLPLLTIQLALDAAIKTEKPETMAEMVLRHALRFSKAETPLQAQKRGENERAIRLAKQWLERDYKHGTLWLLLLAWSWEREGNRDLAKRCLDEISQWCRGKSSEALGWGDWRSKMASFLLGELVGELVEVEGWKEMSSQLLWDYDLSGLAVQLAQAGKFDEALQIAKEIREVPWERLWALREIAEVMAKEGLFEEAIKVAREIEEAAECSETLKEIAEAMAKAGMMERVEETFEEAMKIARKIEDAWDCFWALRGIARVMMKAGMIEHARETFEEAIEVAKKIKDAGEHSEVLREIAEVMAEEGKFEEATKVAKEIKDAEKRSEALRGIAGVMAEEGMMEHAKETLKEAIKAAKKIEGAWERSWELKEIVEMMAKEGLFEEATNVAKEIEKAFWRSEALRGIAEAMTERGMMEHAKETLEETVKVAREIEDAKNRSLTLRRIAEAMVKTGIKERAKEVFEEAMKVAKEIGDEDLHSEVLTEIAVVMAKAGMFEEAMKVVKELGNEGWRSEALIEIAVVMAKERMTERAKETFEEAMKTKMTKEIEDAEWHSKALTEIAIAMAKAGKFEEAMKIAKEIEDARERSRALRWIAGMMVKEGMMERAERVKKAMKIAKGIEDARERSMALSEIAGEMARAGKFKEAMKVLNEIEDAKIRSWIVSEIATEMTKVGKYEEVIEVARKIEDVKLRLWALKEIAAEMAKIGKIEEAMKVAEEIEDAEERSKVLSKIAGEMARIGEFKEAMKVVKGIEDTWWRSDALGEIAVAIARIGNFEKAMRVVNEIEVAWVRSMALGGIAVEMAGAGMFGEAMKLVKEIEDVELRSWALSEIAVEIAEARKFEEAVKMTKEIEDAYERLWALSEILTIMVKVGMFEEAMKVAKEIENAAERSLALSGIAEAMAKEGRREQAQDALEHAFQAAKEVANLDWLWRVAVTAAQLGFAQKAVKFARQVAGEREKGLPEVLDALAERGAKEAVKSLLDLCGWAISTAVKACSCLIRLYPDHATAIAEQVKALV